MLNPRFSQGAALLMMSFCLAACQTVDRTMTSSIPMDDYRVRHPIVLSDTQRSLDIFPTGSGHTLDSRSVGQLEEFAHLYHQLGEGPILVLYPSNGPSSHVPVEQIRRVLAASGARATIRTGSYPVTNSQLASPVRVSFTGLKAKVATKCGEWPNDLASGSTLQGWENKPYWNYGCSYQSMFTAQVADPRDLVGPRGESDMDTQMRSRSIEAVRKGNDPATGWSTKEIMIGKVGGGG